MQMKFPYLHLCTQLANPLHREKESQNIYKTAIFYKKNTMFKNCHIAGCWYRQIKVLQVVQLRSSCTYPILSKLADIMFRKELYNLATNRLAIYFLETSEDKLSEAKIDSLLLSSRCMTNYMRSCSFLHAHFFE